MVATGDKDCEGGRSQGDGAEEGTQRESGDGLADPQPGGLLPSLSPSLPVARAVRGESLGS